MDWAYSLTVIAGSAGVGGFIDFWLGKKGQAKVKDWLETMWIRLDDVHMSNFGRKEAKLALAILDGCFGPSIWSLRRWVMAVIVAFGFGLYSFWGFDLTSPLDRSDFLLLAGGTAQRYMQIGFAVIGFAVSLSVNRLVASLSVRLTGSGALRNFIAFFFMVLVTYYIASVLTPASNMAILRAQPEIARFYIIVSHLFSHPDATQLAVASQTLEYVLYSYSHTLLNWDYFPVYTLIHYPLNTFEEFWYFLQRHAPAGLFGPHGFMILAYCNAIMLMPSMLRFAISIAFLISFLFKPFKILLMTVVLKIVDSDKPVFGMAFGGLAAFARGVEWWIGKPVP